MNDSNTPIIILCCTIKAKSAAQVRKVFATPTIYNTLYSPLQYRKQLETLEKQRLYRFLPHNIHCKPRQNAYITHIYLPSDYDKII